MACTIVATVGSATAKYLFRPYVKACGQCGRATPMVAHQKFCVECMWRSCEVCSSVFKIRQVTQANRFCSLSCRNVAMRGSVPANKGIRPSFTAQCGHCGECISRKRKYCSKRCFGKATAGPKKHRPRTKRRLLSVKTSGDGSQHRHHIVPLHMGGKDCESNIKMLSPAEHADAHYKLWLEHGKVEDWAAYQLLTGQISAEIVSAELRREWARRGGLACRGIKKNRTKPAWNKGFRRVSVEGKQ